MDSHGVSGWPIGINLIEDRESTNGNKPRRAFEFNTGGEREMRHGGHPDRGGPTSHATLFQTPPLIKGRIARGLRNALGSH